MLSERPTADINEIVGAAEKKFRINFTNAKTNIASFCTTVVIIVICLLMEQKG